MSSSGPPRMIGSGANPTPEGNDEALHASSVDRGAQHRLVVEGNLPVESVVVELMTGARYQERYVAMNLNSRVPMLEDGDVRLTESSATLKCFADRLELLEHPRDPGARARANEAMDRLLTELYPEFDYGMILPQLFAHH